MNPTFLFILRIDIESKSRSRFIFHVLTQKGDMTHDTYVGHLKTQKKGNLMHLMQAGTHKYVNKTFIFGPEHGSHVT